MRTGMGATSGPHWNMLSSEYSVNNSRNYSLSGLSILYQNNTSAILLFHLRNKLLIRTFCGPYISIMLHRCSKVFCVGGLLLGKVQSTVPSMGAQAQGQIKRGVWTLLSYGLVATYSSQAGT